MIPEIKFLKDGVVVIDPSSGHVFRKFPHKPNLNPLSNEPILPAEIMQEIIYFAMANDTETLNCRLPRYALFAPKDFLPFVLKTYGPEKFNAWQAREKYDAEVYQKKIRHRLLIFKYNIKSFMKKMGIISNAASI